MILTEIVGFKTLAYEDAFGIKSSGLSLILGKRPKK
jgi:hypothetical protein